MGYKCFIYFVYICKITYFNIIFHKYCIRFKLFNIFVLSDDANNEPKTKDFNTIYDI